MATTRAATRSMDDAGTNQTVTIAQEEPTVAIDAVPMDTDGLKDKKKKKGSKKNKKGKKEAVVVNKGLEADDVSNEQDAIRPEEKQVQLEVNIGGENGTGKIPVASFRVTPKYIYTLRLSL